MSIRAVKTESISYALFPIKERTVGVEDTGPSVKQPVRMDFDPEIPNSLPDTANYTITSHFYALRRPIVMHAA